MIALRDYGDLGRRDARLNEIGLRVPVYPFPALSVHDLRFAKPVYTAQQSFEPAPLPDFGDFETPWT